MARRSAGGVIALKLVGATIREIDRANRRQQKAIAAQLRAQERENERRARQEQAERNRQQRQREAERNRQIKQANSLLQTIAKAMNAASESSALQTKKNRLETVHLNLKELERLNSGYAYNEAIKEIKGGIKAVEKEIQTLQQKEYDEEVRTKSLADEVKEAGQHRERLAKTLHHTLAIDDAIHWDSLLDKADFTTPRPEPFPKPFIPLAPVMPDQPVPPEEMKEPAKPEKEDYHYHPVAVSLLFRSKHRKEKAKRIHSYRTDLRNWIREKQDIQQAKNLAAQEHQKELDDWEAEKASLMKQWTEEKEALIAAWEEASTAALEEWDVLRKEHDARRLEHNNWVKDLEARYKAGEVQAIQEYNALVLRRSEYPENFPKSYELEYQPENRLVIVEYDMPTPSVIPTLKDAKHVKSTWEVKRTYISQKEADALYDGLLYQLALRTVHELFEADVIDAIQHVVFNGWVHSLDKATGLDTNKCILSLQVEKEAFLGINLERIDPKECFKALKGVGSSKLHTITPVAPITRINKEDSRFIDAEDVAGGLDGNTNLAAMDWQEFEHLVRELFEMEFTASGGEVKVTQSSRDGGVDAVAFDPDPIRGGKIVIQAKRYTNVVGVSAIRDLYGTVMNEGANKGIIITTATYGPDAYAFAKEKPLTLLNGGHLLHLLQKHGRKACINLTEAKKRLKAA